NTDSGPLTWCELQQRACDIARRYSREAFARSFRELAGQILDAPSEFGTDRPDSTFLFEQARRHVIRPQQFHLRPPLGETGFEVIRNGCLEFDRKQFAIHNEQLLFFGPYLDLSAGRWRLHVEAEIDGVFRLRLTHNGGILINERQISNAA